MTAKFTNLPWPVPVPPTVHPREETPESEGPVPPPRSLHRSDRTPRRPLRHPAEHDEDLADQRRRPRPHLWPGPPS